MIEHKTWYIEANQLCRLWSEQSGYSVPQIASTIAVLSPLVSWSQNLKWANNLLKDPYAKCLGLQANHDKAIRILNGESINTVLKGDKVKSFYACILRPHCNSVVIDRHMLKIVQWPKSTITSKQYFSIASKVAKRAKFHHLPIPEYQALVWLWQRGDLKQLGFSY